MGKHDDARHKKEKKKEKKSRRHVLARGTCVMCRTCNPQGLAAFRCPCRGYVLCSDCMCKTVQGNPNPVDLGVVGSGGGGDDDDDDNDCNAPLCKCGGSRTLTVQSVGSSSRWSALLCCFPPYTGALCRYVHACWRWSPFFIGFWAEIVAWVVACVVFWPVTLLPCVGPVWSWYWSGVFDAKKRALPALCAVRSDGRSDRRSKLLQHGVEFVFYDTVRYLFAWNLWRWMGHALPVMLGAALTCMFIVADPESVGNVGGEPGAPVEYVTPHLYQAWWWCFDEAHFLFWRGRPRDDISLQDPVQRCVNLHMFEIHYRSGNVLLMNMLVCCLIAAVFLGKAVWHTCLAPARPKTAAGRAFVNPSVQILREDFCVRS